MRAKGLSLTTTTAIVAANMIGTGVFTSLGFQVVDLHSGYTILSLWLLGGLASACGAIVYGELTALMPRSGGEYHFLSKIYHPALGCMAGFVSATVGFAAPIALASIAFGRYAHGASGWLTPQVLAMGVVLLVTAVHLMGNRVGAAFQNVFTSLKVTLLFALAIGAFVFGDPSGTDAFSRPFSQAEVLQPAFAVGLVFVMFAYSGWNAAVYLAGEMRNPGRDVPRALWIGTGIVTVLYLVLNASFLYAVPRSEIAGQIEVGLIAGKWIFGETGGRVIGGLISFGLVSSISAMTWAGPRVSVVMGEDMPPLGVLSRRNSRGTPWVAILLQTALVLIFILTSAFEVLLVWTQTTLLMCAFLTVAGVFVLHARGSAMGAWIRAAALVFLVTTGWMIFQLWAMKPRESLAGLGVLAAGLLVYWIGRKPAVVALFLFAVVLPLSAQTPQDTARLLAGLPVSDPACAAIMAQPAWQEHATALDGLWTRRTGPQIANVNAWAASELGGAHLSVLPVFYFFSGPDFLYVNSIYSAAGTYVLCGKEPVGTVPSLTTLPPDRLAAGWQNLGKSLETILNYSYFITDDMAEDFKRTEFSGVLPVLFVFLARTGREITAVAPVKEPGLSGVRIDFRGAGGAQVLYYFSTDLSNGGIKSSGAFLSFCRKLGSGNSFLKSASYLLHLDEFSMARDFLLSQSRAIVQDDSGIPVRFFSPNDWIIRVYGNYVGPIDLFKKYQQPDLASRYSVSNPKPINFGMGYRFKPEESAILVAFRK